MGNNNGGNVRSSADDRIRHAFEQWYRDKYWNFEKKYCPYDAVTDQYDHLDVELAYCAYKQGRIDKTEEEVDDAVVQPVPD